MKLCSTMMSQPLNNISMTKHKTLKAVLDNDLASTIKEGRWLKMMVAPFFKIDLSNLHHMGVEGQISANWQSHQFVTSITFCNFPFWLLIHNTLLISLIYLAFNIQILQFTSKINAISYL